MRRMMPVCTILIAFGLTVSAQVPQPVYPQVPASPQPVDTGQPIPIMSPNELDNLVAPIALYPDPLLSQVLVASTYPLEIVQAHQWLERNPGLAGPALTQAAEQQNWDPSVQALVMFPDVLRALNQDITWTTNLGNAYLAQAQDVMNAVQRLRQRAQQAGQLYSTPQQTVTATTEAGQPVVIIQPVSPEVIYVPAYDPVWFWGPPVYYPYPHWYYPRRTAGFFFTFGPAVNVGFFLGGGWGGWPGWGWHPYWGNRVVVVNNTFIERHHFNTARAPAFSGTSVWSHDAFHRHGVPYPAAALNDRYRANVQQNLRPRGDLQARVAPRPMPGPAPAPAPFARPAPAPAPAPLARPAPAPAPNSAPFARPAPAPRGNVAPAPGFRVPSEPMGNRQIAPNVPNRNRSVFGGIENGTAARAHIDHGYSSLGPARSAAPPAAPSTPHGAPSGGGGRSRGSHSGHR